MIEYKGQWISKNSDAYKLWLAGKFVELDAHLREVDIRNRDLLSRYK
jgi:hypothetical protein